jgi:transglutaminase-like putative cysteine protease
MGRFRLRLFMLTALAGLLPALARAEEKPKSRTFLFSYSATLKELPAGEMVRIWLPVPPSNEQQKVAIESEELPVKGKISAESEYGNRSLHLEAPAKADGTLTVKMVYRVTRHEVRGEAKITETMEQLARFLKADALVPIDGKPLTLLQGKATPDDNLAAARLFYDLVNMHMRYSKEGTGWGRGDSSWACDSRFGNCSDFHSLFISLTRADKMPAKFEIGFPLPEKHGQGEIPGYHCWAWFKPDSKGWIPVDISEANKNPKMTEYYFGNLTENRVQFSTGRDITLNPPQEGKPLNFFIYPYVEVAGKPHDKMERKFSFEDVTAK